MCGRSKEYGAVSSARSIKNPVLICSEILDRRKNVSSDCHSVPPLHLCSHGADDFARSVQPSLVCDNEDLMSDEARALWARQRKETEGSVKPADHLVTHDYHARMDTVGVAYIGEDKDGQLVAYTATSSGGLLLKSEGRVGSAAIPMASGYCSVGQENCTAALVSGTGECAMINSLAKTLSATLEGHSFSDDEMDEKHLRIVRETFTSPQQSVCGASISVVSTNLAGKIVEGVIRVSTAAPSFGFGVGRVEGDSISVKTEIMRADSGRHLVRKERFSKS
mmetsp:Transcript_33483/g.85619  ORF Transcript_33483/g.85619 Transcript_33483/m.85619 type:complete len:279 (+) Transcript_33483:719-1555(+)